MRHDGSKCAQRLFSLGISFNEWNKQKIACIIQEKEANEKKNARNYNNNSTRMENDVRCGARINKMLNEKAVNKYSSS